MTKTSTKDLLAIQKSLRNILQQVHAFCQKHNIQYSLWAGSLIGAIRHQGMIPWDDDIDLVMERSEYNRFLTLFVQHQEEHPTLFLQTSQTDPKYYFFGFAKIRDLETSGQEHLHVNMPFQSGVFLDIFPLDHLPQGDEKIGQRFQRKVQWYEGLLTLKVGAMFPPKIKHKRCLQVGYMVSILPLVAAFIWPSLWLWILQLPFTLLFILLTLLFITPYRYLVRRRDQSLTQYQDNPSGYVGQFSILKKAHYRMPLSWFIGEHQLVPFDDVEAYASIHYEAILTHLYGNYRKLPPEDQRYGKHAYVGLKTKYDQELER